MLGFIVDDAIGATDLTLSQVAEKLQARGVRMAGCVQDNIGGNEHSRCDMILRVLGTEHRIKISQDLGSCATGCRLDPGALEQTVVLVGESLGDDTELLIINKFGKQELEGRGFREVIGEALSRDIPVLTATGGNLKDGFVGFAGEIAEQVEATPDAILTWVAAQRVPVEAP